MHSKNPFEKMFLNCLMNIKKQSLKEQLLTWLERTSPAHFSPPFFKKNCRHTGIERNIFFNYTLFYYIIQIKKKGNYQAWFHQSHIQQRMLWNKDNRIPKSTTPQSPVLKTAAKPAKNNKKWTYVRFLLHFHQLLPLFYFITDK